jgi:2-oxoglutarate ferredoxin oxidoreductase subunit alpha
MLQARWGTHGDHNIIVLCPISVRQSFDLTVAAFNLSEKFRTPVLLMTDEIIGHMREPVDLPDFNTIQPFKRVVTDSPEDYIPYRNSPGDVPPMASFGTGYRYHVTGLYHDPMGFPTQRLDEIEALKERHEHKFNDHLDEIILVDEDIMDGAHLAVVSYGASARSARHAVKQARQQGLKISLVSLLTIWPFAEKAIERLADEVDQIIVPEMNQGQIAREVERIAGRKKVVRVNRTNGEMVTPQMILNAIEED